MTKLFKAYLKNGVSTGDNLLGFEIDIESYLEMSETFKGIRVSRTGDTNCLIVAKCKYASTTTPDEVAKELEEIWMDSLRYQEFEKHVCKIQERTVVFYFCTTSDHLGVTGKIETTCT